MDTEYLVDNFKDGIISRLTGYYYNGSEDFCPPYTRELKSFERKLKIRDFM